MRFVQRGLTVTGLSLALAVGGALHSGITPLADAASVPVVRQAAAGLALSAGPGESASQGSVSPFQYPYPTQAEGVRLDSYGFVVGQCTSFVAWWLNAHAVPFALLTRGPAGVGTFLNASGWDSSARAAGFQVGDRPVVGAIAQWHSGETSRRFESDGRIVTLAAGQPGHVAVVTAVLPDGQAQWVEYGWGAEGGLHVGYGYAPRYLYIGVPAPR